MGRTPLALTLILAASALAAPPATAAEFLVNSTADAPADGDCSASCTLRDAVELANAGTELDVIKLPPGDYLLTQNAQLALTQPVDIRGVSGATARNTKVRGNGSARVFKSAGNVTLTGFAISGGQDSASGEGGGGIYQESGNLVIRDVLVTGNTATGADKAQGGGISDRSSGTLTIEDSAIVGNQVMGGTEEGSGGGLRVSANTGLVSVTNTTIDGNTASGGGGSSRGGGIATASPSLVQLQNTTISANKVTGASGFGGNILASAGPTVSARNTLVAGGAASSSANCAAAPNSIDSRGNNLEPSIGCQFDATSDKHVDPKLSALADNGGPTDTRAFPATSGAADGGSSTGCPAADQRGVSRPQGPACDMGAFELEGGGSGGDSGGGDAGGGAGGSDTKAPVFSALALSRTAFPAAPSGPSARKAARTYGTKVSYRLSEKAKTKFTVERAAKGRRVGGKCKVQTRANRTRPRCTRYKAVRGSFTRTGEAGRNSFRFTGRIGGKRLTPGRYRLVAAARDDAGNKARVVRRAFRIVP
jgi:CSLREA domain-containing protein